MWIDLYTEDYRPQTLVKATKNITRLISLFREEQDGMTSDRMDEAIKGLRSAIEFGVQGMTQVNVRWFTADTISMINLDAVNAMIQLEEDELDEDMYRFKLHNLNEVTDECMRVSVMLT